MIKSMTGFGRWELIEQDKKICIEIKSVNHRYLDINIRMPKKFNAFESEIRKIVSEYAARGKIDIFINYEELSGNTIILKYNAELAKQYLSIFSAMSKQLEIDNGIDAVKLSNYPEVITTEEHPMDEDEIIGILKPAVIKACEIFTQTRVSEGIRLMSDLEEKLNLMAVNVKYILDRSPIVLDEYRQKLEGKVKELLENSQIDDSRVALEVTLYTDKNSIDEELVRLNSHIIEMNETLSQGNDIGRKLDFLAQEMNREANTILSKSSDLDISNKAIQLKTDIEKIREQVQNIE